MRSQTGVWEREKYSFAHASGSLGSPCHLVTLSPCHLVTLSSPNLVTPSFRIIHPLETQSVETILGLLGDDGTEQTLHQVFVVG